MFHFQKKTKIVSRNNIQNKKTSFAKKLAIHRKTSSDNITQKTRAGFYWIYLFLWLGFFGVTVYVLLFSPFLRISTINIDGTVDIPAQDMKNFVRENISDTKI